jgi:hypothetical protein
MADTSGLLQTRLRDVKPVINEKTSFTSIPTGSLISSGICNWNYSESEPSQ